MISAEKYLKNFTKYRFLLQNLITRDIKVKYRRSVLGLVWSILNPLLMMLVITAVFQKLFRFAVPYFPVYYLTGSLIFNFVSEATTGAMTSIVDGGSLLKKVYIPKYIFPLEKCLFAFVNMLFSLVATFIIIAAQRMPVTWTIVFFPIPMIYALIFSIGLGLILASMNVFFRDVGHLYGVFITAWIYLTPVMYPVEILPDIMIKLMSFNPMYHFINYFRNVVMYNTLPSFMSNIYCMTFALVFLVVGVIFFKSKQDKFILYI